MGAVGLCAVLSAMAFIPSLTNAQATDQLQDDINYARSYMQQYENDLKIIASPSGYGDWGFRIDTDGLENLNGIIRDAQTAYLKEQYDDTARLLQQWQTEWQNYDAVVGKTTQDIDFRWLNNNLLAKEIPQVEAWLKDLKSSGYQIDSFIDEWNKLKDQLSLIQSSWSSSPSKWQGELYTWLDAYTAWSKRIEAKVTELDNSAYSSWKKSLQEWIDFDQSYFDAEGDDIASAAKDGLAGAQEDLDLLNKMRPLLDQAREALKNNNPAETDRLLNQIDHDLMQRWSKEAIEFRKQIGEREKDFGVWLQDIRSRIDALKQTGADVSELEKSFVETSEALTDAKDAAARHCSTYSECGDKLDEYDGYYANARYTDIETWRDWWEAQLEEYESSQPVSYYVEVNIDPIAETNLGDTVTGPATIYVDAPGATKAEVYLRSLDDNAGSGERKLLGVADASNDFSIDWAADEPYQTVEITATAYGQPDVDYSRTSEPATVVMPSANTVQSAEPSVESSR